MVTLEVINDVQHWLCSFLVISIPLFGIPYQLKENRLLLFKMGKKVKSSLVVRFRSQPTLILLCM